MPTWDVRYSSELLLIVDGVARGGVEIVCRILS